VLWGAGLSLLAGAVDDSTGLESVGDPGPGKWVTIYANAGHAYIEVAGIYFDTAAGLGNPPNPPYTGPRWASWGPDRPGSSLGIRPGCDQRKTRWLAHVRSVPEVVAALVPIRTNAVSLPRTRIVAAPPIGEQQREPGASARVQVALGKPGLARAPCLRSWQSISAGVSRVDEGAARTAGGRACVWSPMRSRASGPSDDRVCPGGTI
jgi:hypothetical protein